MAPELQRILDLHRRGAQVQMRRNSVGKGHVKVRHGPMKLLTSRFTLDGEEYESLKRLIAAGPQTQYVDKWTGKD
jgi:hypothetical protein